MELGVLWRALQENTICRVRGHRWKQHVLRYPSGRVEFSRSCTRCRDFRAPGV
jgi:hypothetical protein